MRRPQRSITETVAAAASLYFWLLTIGTMTPSRNSLAHPRAYVQCNVAAFLNVLEACRQWKVEHLVYALSSSVYGANPSTPFSEHHAVDHPLTPYAVTKRTNELLAHSYSWMHGLPTTGLRLFTVYGPWGRPDMAVFAFTQAIIENRPIELFNHGQMQRDFTYIDDVVEAVIRILDRPPAPNSACSFRDPATSQAPYRLYNVGRGQAIELM